MQLRYTEQFGQLLEYFVDSALKLQGAKALKSVHMLNGYIEQNLTKEQSDDTDSPK